MKLALYSRSVEGSDGLGPEAILDHVAELGLDGCLFASPLELSARLDLAELQAVRDHAGSLGLYIEVALGQINPFHFSARPDLLALGDGDMRVALERVLHAVCAIGCTDLMFSIGTLADRFSQSTAWHEQLQATDRFLASLAPLLRDLGCRLDLKTHEEITSFEILRLVESVGPDVLGASFDPVNVLARVEDPLAAARRLAPYVRQVHIDDALLRLTERGLDRWLCPCGSGVLDWPAILAALPNDVRLTIELHRAHLEMPIFDPNWLAAQPELTILEFAAVLKLAQASRSRRLDQSFQTSPSLRLEPTLAYLRALPIG
jgi:3-oxoisoapionate decarboxylase